MSHFLLHVVIKKDDHKHINLAEEYDYPKASIIERMDEIFNAKPGIHNVSSLLEDILEPYSEDLEVAPYVQMTKQELIDNNRQSYINLSKSQIVAEYNADPVAFALAQDNPRMIASLEALPANLAMSDDEHWVQITHDYSDMLDAKGNFISSYNPASKWDWWELGGRFAQSLYTKDSENVTMALVKDIAFSPETTNPPYAILHDGEWSDPGEMLMFGQSAQTEDSKVLYVDKYNAIIDGLDPEDLIVVVDCHI